MVWAALSTRLGVMRRIVIAGRKGMPCSHTTGVRIRPWLSASCSLDSAATVPSMGSLDLSEESLTRVGEAPVRGPPPTLGKLATLKVCCYMSVLTPLVD